MRVLFVEDEKLLADALAHLFEKNKMTADKAYDGKTGLELARKNNYDLIVLDIMLPEINGLEILKILREEGHNEAILMLTAKDQLEDKIEGLNLGADDYLVKPFETEELLARANALNRRIRRDKPKENYLIKETLELISGDKRISLTAKEYDILEYLLKDPSHPKSKERLLKDVWQDLEITENSVELYIHYLRKKLEDTNLKIKTIRGQGYLIKENGSAQ